MSKEEPGCGSMNMVISFSSLSGLLLIVLYLSAMEEPSPRWLLTLLRAHCCRLLTCVLLFFFQGPHWHHQFIHWMGSRWQLVGGLRDEVPGS